MRLILKVTEQCNMRCTYCFEKRSNTDMSMDTMTRAVDLIRGCSGVRIGFYGGEPLMRKDLILRAIDRSLLVSDNPSFFMTTNGSMLDEEFLEMTYDVPFRFSISHDGTRVGRTRPLFGAYSKQIIDNASELLLKYRPDSIAVCTYYPGDVSGLSDDVRVLTELGFMNICLNPVANTSGWDYEELENVLAEIVDDNKDIAFSGLSGSGPSECEDGENIYVMPDGRLFPCHIWSEYPELCMGNVVDGIDKVRRETLLGRIPAIPVECLGCDIYPCRSARCSCARLMSVSGRKESICDYERMLTRLSSLQ